MAELRFDSCIHLQGHVCAFSRPAGAGVLSFVLYSYAQRWRWGDFSLGYFSEASSSGLTVIANAVNQITIYNRSSVVHS